MIVYFASRKLDILGLASTDLKNGVNIVADNKVEDVDSGSSTFSFTVEYDNDFLSYADTMTEPGNYILKNDGDDQEFYTIIDTTVNRDTRSIQMFCEDAGLDLINTVIGPYSANAQHTIDWYISAFVTDDGFEIGTNEVDPTLQKQLSWSSEETAKERLLSLCAEFDEAELSFSFEIKGLSVEHKYINVHKKRGQDNGETLRLGKEVSDITISKTVSNLATAFYVVGGSDDNNNVTTLNGYSYDDGDFYVDGYLLKCRSAGVKWGRYSGSDAIEDRHIIRRFSYETTSQIILCAKAIEELKKVKDAEVNYDASIAYLPPQVRIGDRINIVDSYGNLYLSTRILHLEKSITSDTYTATFGEFKIKSSGISEKVTQLAAEFRAYTEKNPVYIWIVYADDASGTGITTDSTNKNYIGIYHTRAGATPDLSDPTVYSWTKIKGEDGSSGIDGNVIWVANADPTEDQTGLIFTFNKTDIIAQSGKHVKVGDVIFAGDYRYLVTAVGSTTIEAANREQLKGDDGYSPTVTIDTSTPNQSTITITDTNGDHITTIFDGQDGDDGISVSSIKQLYTYSLYPTLLVPDTESYEYANSAEWRIGTIRRADGNNISATYRLRLRNISSIVYNSIIIPDGYKVAIYGYSRSDGGYLGMWKEGTGFQTESNWFVTGNFDLNQCKISGANYFRFVLSKDDESDFVDTSDAGLIMFANGIAGEPVLFPNQTLYPSKFRYPVTWQPLGAPYLIRDGIPWYTQSREVAMQGHYQWLCEETTWSDGSTFVSTPRVDSAYIGLISKISSNHTNILQNESQINQLASSITRVGDGLNEYMIEADSQRTQTAKMIMDRVSYTYQTKSDMGKYSTTTQMESAIAQTASGIRAEVYETYQTKDGMDDYVTRTVFEQTTDGISSQVSQKTSAGEVNSLIEQKANYIRAEVDGPIVWNATNSSMTENGTFTCNNGNFTGTISGSILEFGPDQNKISQRYNQWTDDEGQHAGLTFVNYDSHGVYGEVAFILSKFQVYQPYEISGLRFLNPTLYSDGNSTSIASPDANNGLKAEFTGSQLDIYNAEAAADLTDTNAKYILINRSNLGVIKTNMHISGLSTILQAKGTGSVINLTAGTIIKVPLQHDTSIQETTDISVYDGGVQVYKAGKYKITGSVYITADNDSTAFGVYIYKGNDEIFSSLMPKPTGRSHNGAITVGPKLVELSANDIVYLKARVTGSTGSVNPVNVATYLLIEKVY